MWGTQNLQPSASACCKSCRDHSAAATKRGEAGCAFWVFCGEPGGCATQKQGECWLKRREKAHDVRPTVRSAGEGCAWTSGAIMTLAEAAELRGAEEAAARVVRERRERPTNPHVFFEVEVARSDGRTHRGRIEFVLYAAEAPRAAENFRAMCTGERGGKLTYTGMSFYRILDQFIDQAGRHGASSVWGGAFDDDPGGLALKHDRGGLLSAANSGPDTNSGHFSIVVAPAPHLNGGYTIFGEVVSGMETVMAINRLSPPGSPAIQGKATVTLAGCTANCAPLKGVGPKCKTREKEMRPVQGRQMHPCLD